MVGKYLHVGGSWLNGTFSKSATAEMSFESFEMSVHKYLKGLLQTKRWPKLQKNVHDIRTQITNFSFLVHSSLMYKKQVPK